MFFVRSASSRDVVAIHAIFADSWRATYSETLGAERIEALIASAHTPEKIAAKIEQSDGEFLVADNGGALGGLAFATRTADGNAVFLHHLHVAPGLYRNGIGRDLFAEIETCFPGARTLALHVDADNHRAIAFYEAHGMAVTAQKNAEDDEYGIACLVMEKSLAP